MAENVQVSSQTKGMKTWLFELKSVQPFSLFHVPSLLNYTSTDKVPVTVSVLH